jgi:hypothetical protein
MRDLDELFGTLDAMPAPDVSKQARARLGDPEPPMPPLRGGRGNKPVAIVVAFLVFAAAAAFAWHAATTTGTQPATSVSPPVTDPLASIPTGWTELPKPPEQPQGSASLWTGNEVIDWGGYLPDKTSDASPYQAGGFAFDPASNTWSAIPPAPGARTGAVGVWTGTEALFLFGWDGSKTYPDGFAFDPTADSWRTIAAAPISPSSAVAVWTGTQVIVWGESRDKGATGGPDVATYDPGTDTWRRIAEPPFGLNLASGVWTGDRFIVFGSFLDNGNHASTHTSVGLSYDPTSDRWTELPPSQLSPQATSAAWAGDRLVAWDYDVHSEVFDPATQRWSDPIRMPLQFHECYPDSAVVSGSVFAFFCGDAALYDVATSEWQRIHGGLLEPTTQANGARYSLWRFADLIPTGEVIFFEAEGLTVNDSGTPCYGCSGSPTSFWAYRPG